jgi:hypothetical protein
MVCLQKSVSKFTTKMFYEIDPRALFFVSRRMDSVE